MNIKLAKLLGGAAAGALLLSSAGVAFAQTYSNGNGTGSIVPSSDTNTTGTGATTGSSASTNSGSASSSSSGSVLGASTTDPNVPNTGAGGNTAGTLAALTLSALAALGGGAFLLRQRRIS